MERGYSATSIDDVARRLGATKGRIYHHYSSKSDLFADVFRFGMEMNYRAIEPLRRSGERAVERWRKMALIHVVQMISTRQFQRVVWEGVEMQLRGATTPEQRTAFAELIERPPATAISFAICWPKRATTATWRSKISASPTNWSSSL
jgi:AcrR family transcriptional regulator